MRITAILFIFFFSGIAATKKRSSPTPQGTFKIDYIDEHDLLIVRKKEETSTRMGRHDFIFAGKTFAEIRQPSCGNDISFHKKGKISISSSKPRVFVLMYSHGSFQDNVGSDSMQDYVKGKVTYNLLPINSDSFKLKWISGTTEKTILRQKNK
jgi:hypothetical protein